MILVTGGAGFIGSNLVHALTKAKEEFPHIVVCDEFGTEQKWKNLASSSVVDIISPQQLFSFLDANTSHIQVIVHLGASSSTTESDVDFILKNNVRLSLDLWHWCGRHRVRFLYASSAATYGKGEHGFVDDYSYSYLAKLRPQNPYGWSKSVFDQAVVQNIYIQDRPVPLQWAGLKFFNVYGPNEYHKKSQQSVIPTFFEQIQSEGRVKLFESSHPEFAHGEQRRDFVDVRDCVDVMLWLLRNPGVNGIYNCGTGQARTFNDLASAMFEALEMPTHIDYVTMPAHIKEHYQYHTQADLARLRAKGYQKEFLSLEEGVSDYLKHYLTQANPYR